jgi:hypothetical protein
MSDSPSPPPKDKSADLRQGDFELVIKHLNRAPSATAKQLSADLRRNGHARFTTKLVNQVLYRLLAAQFIERDGSKTQPRWTVSQAWTLGTQSKVQRDSVKRPLRISTASVIVFKIADTEVRLIEDDSLSQNDSYIQPDWVGSHIVVSVNTNHPFWKMRLTTEENHALFRLTLAVDAYVLWKTARLMEPPDASEVMKLRDYALRFSTLESTEQLTNDYRCHA